MLNLQQGNNTNKNFNKAQLTTMLTDNEVRLTYTSKDTGETKTFRASLKPSDLLPTTTVRETAEDNILVVNLDKRAWRSLAVANISKAEII